MKYVLITGAYGGMGYATVKKLKSEGFCVFAMDKNVKEPEENVIPLCADVTNEKSVCSAAQKVSAITKELFAIIHFAGVYALDSLIEMSEEKFERVIKINFLGAARVNRVFAPFVAAGGRIVMTTSELAPLSPLPFTGLYAVSKAALDKYAFSLRMEMQLYGIYVSVIRAGAVDTGMLDVSTTALNRFCENTKRYKFQSKKFKKIVDKVEAKKIPPEKIAAMTLKILRKKHPRFAYPVNRNFLLMTFNALPKSIQFAIIRKVLK